MPTAIDLCLECGRVIVDVKRLGEIPCYQIIDLTLRPDEMIVSEDHFIEWATYSELVCSYCGTPLDLRQAAYFQRKLESLYLTWSGWTFPPSLTGGLLIEEQNGEIL